MTADDLAIKDEQWPPARGVPGVTQGRYGTRDNLEIVSCAADSGLWVGWFNNDAVETRSGAALDRWSGALRFARGHRYAACTITQVAAGPDFLEVLARTDDGDLRRHVWSPDAGFVDHGLVATGVLAASRLVETADGRVHAAVVDAGGTWILTAGDGDPASPAYPEMSFGRRPLDPRPALDVDLAIHDDHVDVLLVQPDHTARHQCGQEWTTLATRVTRARLHAGHALVVDDRGQVVLHALAAGERLALAPGEAADLAISAVDGRLRWEAIIRSGAELRHTRGSLSPLAVESSARLDAAVWCPPGTATVHRDPR